MEFERSSDFLLKDTKLLAFFKTLFEKYPTQSFDASSVLADLPKIDTRAEAGDQVDSFYNNLSTLVDLGLLSSEGGDQYRFTLDSAIFLDSLEEPS